MFQSYCLVHLYGMLVANYRPFAVFIIIIIIIIIIIGFCYFAVVDYVDM